MKEILIQLKCGTFAENKDFARYYREKIIKPALERNEDIIINFEKVESATQSFVHALLSDVTSKYGESIFSKISFKNCNSTVKIIIGTVISYSLE